MTVDEGLLSGYRVLDLTDTKGHLCGKILGDFGADVIKIEKPGGDPSRNRGPFSKNVPDAQRSLLWFAYNTSKRGITLNIEVSDGQHIFKRLLESADFVIESFDPGYMDSIGLGYAELGRVKPDIIMTSISAFGQNGPFSHYRATDLTAGAMGGLVRIMGDPGRPPVRMSCDPQAYLQAGLHGALGSMVALYHRNLTGEGQHVDVSMQEAVELSTMIPIEVWDMMKASVVGMGQFYESQRRPPQRPLLLRWVFPCKDGHVVFYYGGGQGGIIESSSALVRWGNEEGMILELKDYDFTKWDGSTMPQEELDRQVDAVGRFLMTKTKDELYEGAVKKKIMLCPCANTTDILRNRQLEARGFWEKVHHPELGDTLVYPGAPLKMQETPWGIQRRAPLIGEHNEEVYGEELGFSREELAILKSQNVL